MTVTSLPVVSEDARPAKETQACKDSLIADPRLASAAPNISGDFALSPTSLAVGRGADLGGENQMALFPSLAWPAQVQLVAQEPGRWDIGAFRHTP
jgi:hypothetical protein